MEKTGRRKLPLWFRIAMGIVIAIFALIAVGVGLRFWITSDGGRAFILSQIDGKKLGPLGTIRVQGLKGDPLDAATFADITLVDDDGIWLRAKDARIEWTPTDLFMGQLEIRAVSIRLVNVLRAPRTTYQNENSPPPDIGLSLEKVDVDELAIADNVFGPNASYRVSGGAARQRDASGFARLQLMPISGPADAADITAQWSDKGLTGVATLKGPAGGLIAALTQAPANKAVTFDGKLDGTMAKFAGTALLAFDGEAIASFDISRDGAAGHISADVAAGQWPLLAPLAERAGGAMKLTGEADLTDFRKAPAKLHLIAGAGTVDVVTTMNFESYTNIAPLRVNASRLDLASAAPPLKGKLDVAGEVKLAGLTDFQFTGDTVATQVAWPSGRAAHVSAPVTVSKEGNAISWATTGAVIEGARVDALPSLAPARYTLATRGEVNLKTQMVEIYQSQLHGAPGDVSARGTYAIRNGAIDFSGAAKFMRLADVAPLTGSAQARWTVKQASAAAPIRITADAEGRNVSSSIEALSELAGPEPRVRIAGVVRGGRFAVESGSIDGQGIRATMSGRIADSGAIVAQASGSLVRPLDLSGVRVEAATFNADVAGDLDAPKVALRLSDGVVSLAGVTVKDVSGAADVKLGETTSGQFSLTGGSADQKLNAKGEIHASDGDWRITNLSASLGQLKLTAPTLAYADGALSVSFDANGPLAGLGGLTSGTLNAKGNVKVGETIDADVTGRLAGLKNGQMRLETLAFTAKASGDTARLETHAIGKIGAAIDVTSVTTARRNGEEWSGEQTLTGTVDKLEVSTPTAALWRYGANGWALNAQIKALGGTLDADLASTPAEASARLTLGGMNMRALTHFLSFTPMDGTISGTASFRHGAGPADGRFELNVADANPVGVTADRVQLKLAGNLAGEALHLSAEGTGQGFTLNAVSDTRVSVGGGFNVIADQAAAVTASLDLKGRAEQLWALFGPDDQSLRGALEANVRVAGTLGRPNLSGGFTIADGAYEHAETGLRLRAIAARGEFDQHSARISGVSAEDGKGGRLTGDGQITWDKDVAGAVKFSATNLRALGRDDRFAILSGDGSLSLEPDAIHVNGDFTVSQARISVEQPASSVIPTLPGLRRVNFVDGVQDDAMGETPPWLRPVQLDLKVKAPNRVVVFGRGLDTEWGANLHITGPISDPSIDGEATLVRGDLDLAGRRFQFDTGTITLDGPIRLARLDISAERSSTDITASVHVTGSPVEPKFTLESTPTLPQDEILARVLFGRSAGQLSGFEAAQLAAGLAQLAGGQAGFDPAGLVRKATGLDRVLVGAEDGIATVAAGKYVADNVYLQVGAGGEGGVGAQVEWEPQKNVSIISSAQGNGDTKIALRWKKDY